VWEPVFLKFRWRKRKVFSFGTGPSPVVVKSF
jgi:hypothetical protein